jgi:hypothetical protein
VGKCPASRGRVSLELVNAPIVRRSLAGPSRVGLLATICLKPGLAATNCLTPSCLERPTYGNRGVLPVVAATLSFNPARISFKWQLLLFLYVRYTPLDALRLLPLTAKTCDDFSNGGRRPHLAFYASSPKKFLVRRRAAFPTHNRSACKLDPGGDTARPLRSFCGCL